MLTSELRRKRVKNIMTLLGFHIILAVSSLIFLVMDSCN